MSHNPVNFNQLPAGLRSALPVKSPVKVGPSQCEPSNYSPDTHDNNLSAQAASGQTVIGYRLNSAHVPPDVETFIKRATELEASLQKTHDMAKHIARVIVSGPRQRFYATAGALHDPIDEWGKMVSHQVRTSYPDTDGCTHTAQEQRFSPMDMELAAQVESMTRVVRLMNNTGWPTMNIRNRPKWNMIDEQVRRKALCLYLDAVTIIEHAALVLEPALLASASRKLAVYLRDAVHPILSRTHDGKATESMAGFLYHEYPSLRRAQRVSAMRKMLIGYHSHISVHGTRANEILLRLYGSLMKQAYDDIITSNRPFIEDSIVALRFIARRGQSPAVQSAALEVFNTLSRRLRQHGDSTVVAHMQGKSLADFVGRAIPPVDAPDFSKPIVESTYEQYSRWSIYVRNLLVAQWAQLDGRENEILSDFPKLKDALLQGNLKRNNMPKEIGLSRQLAPLAKAIGFVDPATKMDALVLASHCINALQTDAISIAVAKLATTVRHNAERIIKESMNRYDVYAMMTATLALHRVLPSLPHEHRDRTAMQLAAYYSGLMNVLTTEDIFPVITSFSNLVAGASHTVLRRHEELFANGLWILNNVSNEFTVPKVRELARKKSGAVKRSLAAAGIDADRHYGKLVGMRFALSDEDQIPPDTIPVTSHSGTDSPQVSQRDMQFTLMPV